ncbi:MAG: DUF3422 domain-containing protein [Burkholderiales bacterium]|jgi:uncharacterized membrane-anchored protein|nr:DUF3422 domain-containing protein [Burkholderiales bacterium]
MSRFPPDHPQRVTLADEIHARPSEPLGTPARATYVALFVEPEAREHEVRQIQGLCRRFDLPGPPADATHFRATLGDLRLKWERHGEFSGYTFIADGLSPTPFDAPAESLLPARWLASLPGTTIAAVHAEVCAAGEPVDADALALRFSGRTIVGTDIADGDAVLYTDFRLHDDGCSRLWLVNRGMTDAQTGRTLQRVFEIEAYRVLALLALPIARRQAPRIAAIEAALATLTDRMAQAGADDESVLHELTRLAAEVESGIAASQFRFGACDAYHGLVRRRIAELRESRLHGLQTIDEFMSRRLAPAVATCANVARRLEDLAERVGQASALLATRVGIEREHQNQSLLASMDRRARLQLRLQQTVEGLSVAAIVYYVAGLVGYLAKAAHGAGLPVAPDLAVGIAIPIAAGFMFMAVRRTRRHLADDTH